MPNRQLIEIASWRIAAELLRRTPGSFKIIETHPGGGQYDCLSLLRGRTEHMAAFNRAGSLAIFQRFDDRVPRYDGSNIWMKALRSESYRQLLDELSEALGLPIPSRLPPSTAEVIVFRTIALGLTPAAFGTDQWECRNGMVDTSGFGGGVADAYFDSFRSARERLAAQEPNDLFGSPAYRFWFLLKNERPVVCLETTGVAWDEEGREYDLVDRYRKSRRIMPLIWALVGRHLA